MEIKLTTYQKDHQALDPDAPGYMAALHAWSADYCAAHDEVAMAVAAVVSAAIEQQVALMADGALEAADALGLDIDRVLDAMSPSMLAHFDALRPSCQEKEA